MIKFVFLDLDDTILDFHKAERLAIKKTIKDLDIKPTKKVLNLYSKINLSEWKRLEKKELTHEQLKVERFEIFFRELNLNFDAKKTTKIYENHLSIGHFFIKGAIATIKKLYKDYHLFIISNGLVKIQKGRLESAKIEKYFDKIFVSEEIGFNKPDVRYFENCFKQIEDFEPQKAVIIGDSLSSDVSGGKNSNLRTIWFNKNNEKNDSNIIPDFEIKKLKQIKKIIKSI